MMNLEKMSQLYNETFSENGAENYQQYFVPVIPEPLAIDLIKSASIKPGEKVLDVACGTGVVTRFAAEKAGTTGSTIGVDINPGMIEIARSVTPSNLNIEWYQSSADLLPFPDNSFDVVLCQLSLQFFPDKLSALKEMHRVLEYNGRIIINVPGSIHELFEIFAESLAQNISPELEEFVLQVFSLNDTARLTQIINQAGFREVSVQNYLKALHLPKPKEFLWQYIFSTPLATMVNNVGVQSKLKLENDITAKWQKFVENESMQYKQDILLAVGRK